MQFILGRLKAFAAVAGGALSGVLAFSHDYCGTWVPWIATLASGVATWLIPNLDANGRNVRNRN